LEYLIGRKPAQFGMSAVTGASIAKSTGVALLAMCVVIF
jgi:hypothetical protein